VEAMASISSTEDKLKTYRLTSEEHKKIRELLGREPEGVEWALFSALWSEHCSYKSSKVHLKKLFNSSSRVMQSMGENAGVLDLGRGERIAFKIESHNHPSFIEPYQGAATGVGGIIRDILTMGARPIALANYLCFGDGEERSPKHVDGVVRGIGGYGNCVGVAMVTGQTEFHSSYNKNILVNAFCLGYFGPKDTVVSSGAKGEGNLVVYVGAKTGRDGIHGARMASESFNKGDESKRPNIQIGDPFFEKLLIESFLEVVEAGVVVCAQDMGAAGLISSTFEMASKGNVGFDMYLDKVPLRDPTMNPEEMLVSESQERMVLVCEPKNLGKVQEIFAKWGLDAVEIGKVIPKRVMRIHWKGEVITEIDPHALVENAPQWQRPFEETPKTVDTRYFLNSDEPKKKLERALTSLQGCGRRWIYEQYDQQVGTQTMLDCRDSVGAVRLPSGRSVAVALGGRPHMLRLNAFIGGADSLAEPSLRLMSKGYTPIGSSDCLNYGNPENPKVMGEFKNSLEGMSEAARVFDSPIISGNVSFYNQTGNQNITSTPAVTVIGLREDDGIPAHDHFSESGLNLYLVRSLHVRTNGMWSVVNNEDLGGKGEINFEMLKNFGTKLLSLSKSAQASKLSGKFGLAYSLARMCVNVGATVKSDLKKDDFFLERLYDFVFATKENWKPEVTKDYEIISLGKTGGDRLQINEFIDVPISELREQYTGGWRKHFEELA
jgi:phosphoribosylformylglycinamidine synthase subunit PurL